MSNPFVPPDYEEIQKRIKNEGGSSYWGGYFKQGIYGATPSQKKSFYGRILPMFDYFNLSPADENFPTSWAPYRDVNKISHETNQPALNSFFGLAYAYSWFGNKSVSFISPSSRRFTEGVTRGHECIDPIMDIRNYAKKHEDKDIRALTEREENKKEAKLILPYPQLRYFFNFYGSSSADRNVRNYVIDVSKKAFEDLATKLSEWRPAHEKVVDPNWDNYLFGDITDPENGLAVETASIPSNPQPFNGFVLASGTHKSLKNVKQVPVPIECLAKRVQFFGPDNGFKIMSAQEIVDFIVEDGSIPYHLIQTVCSDYANVPPQPKRNSTTSFGDSEEEDAYVPPIPSSAFKPKAVQPAASPAPAPKKDMPEPVAVKPLQDMYWVKVGSSSPVKKPKSEVTDFILNSGADAFSVKVCKVGDSAWASAYDAGFAAPAAEEDLPPPFDEDLPPPFEDVQPAKSFILPKDEPTSAPPSVQVKSKEEAFTPDMKEELEKLESEFLSMNSNMHPQSLVRMTHLRKLSGKASVLPS